MLKLKILIKKKDDKIKLLENKAKEKEKEIYLKTDFFKTKFKYILNEHLTIY